MINKIVTTSLVVSALLLSACGNGGEGESVLQTQQLLDNRDYDGVIAKLENNATTLSNDDSIALASAYMGKAGFSLASIIGIVATNANGAGDAFTAFIKDAVTNSSNDAIGELEIAKNYYNSVLQTKCLDTQGVLSSSESDLCLYAGLANIAQTTVSINSLTDNINALGNGADNKLKASICAMQYANDGSTGECSVSPNADATFTQSGTTYKSIDVTYNGNSFEYLLTKAVPSSTVITKGFCPLDDFSKRVLTKNSTGYEASYHVCPTTETATTQEITTQKVLVDALNNSTDLLATVATDDVKKDVEKFKQEILVANGRQNDSNKTLTDADIIKYLQDNNK